MRQKTLHRIQRYLYVICFAILLWIALITTRIVTNSSVTAVFNQRIALISGHAGYDSGAVCMDADGNPAVIEAEINAKVAQLVAEKLRRSGADVEILEEFDSQLAGLQADLLLSIHADSCIDVSGYKAARYPGSAVSADADRLIRCIDHFYPAATGLTLHSNTITHNMTDYHAFRQIDPSTPAAIIELGFLGADQNLLVNRPDVVARGITDSLICFFEPDSTTTTEDP